MEIKLVKSVSVLLATIILLAGIVACSSTPPPASPTATPSQPTPSATSTATSPATTRTITDVAKRTVTVPTTINRIICLNAVPDNMVWILAPGKLVSITRTFNANSVSSGTLLFPASEMQQLKALPLGPIFADPIDSEKILALHPDIIISVNKDPNLDSLQSKLKIPIVAISKEPLSDYEPSLRFVGDLLGKQKEGIELADYWHSLIKRVTDASSQIPEKGRLKVYFANTALLSTVGSATVMASIINLAGGIDFASANKDFSIQSTSESATVSQEQVLAWNPDVIITKYASQRDAILSSANWADVSAVKSKRVYCCLRYETMDGLTSLVSLGWLASTLYPDKVKFDTIAESKAFYSKFYRNDSITDAQILQEQNEKY